MLCIEPPLEERASVTPSYDYGAVRDHSFVPLCHYAAETASAYIEQSLPYV